MRIKITEALEFYNDSNPLNKLSKRKLAARCMPEVDIKSSQAYLKKINEGDFGKTGTVNLNVIKRVMAITGVTLTFIIDLS